LNWNEIVQSASLNKQPSVTGAYQIVNGNVLSQ